MLMVDHQSIKDWEADGMKLLIVLGLFPLFSANSDSFYPGFPLFPPPKNSNKATAIRLQFLHWEPGPG